MSNSSLATYRNISPARNSPRNHAIDTITIHCIVGQWTAKQGCDYFTRVEASANYVVGKDGSIGISVNESDRSWCSSNSENDNRAITIEVASDTVHPYTVTNEAYEALIKLCADVCKRNGIKKLVWSTDKNVRVNHLYGANMTCHRDFANKACPGDYLYSREGDIAKRVNEIICNNSNETKVSYEIGDMVEFTGNTHYISSTSTKGEICKPGKARITIISKDAPHPYHIIWESGGGSNVYGWVNANDISKQSANISSYLIKVTADVLNIRTGPGTNYATNGDIRDNGVYTIVAESDGKGATRWGKLKSGAGWISLDYVNKL